MGTARLIVTVQYSHLNGTFKSRDDVISAIVEELEGADPAELDVDGTAYEITDWSVADD